MNRTEENYTASEAEMLALVWTTKYFRYYLYGRRFLVRTDHAALTYMRNFADNNHHFMRWSLKLSEMDITVEHKAGAKIAHVDALSRQVGVVMNEGSLNREAILREQASDEFCQKQRPGTYFGKCEFFLEDGLIYRRHSHDRHLDRQFYKS